MDDDSDENSDDEAACLERQGEGGEKRD